MRTNVSFRHPAAFVALPETEDVLATSGATWFRDLLTRVPDLVVGPELCQEDWGVVAFAERNGRKFWVGISLGLDDNGSWLVHFHHASFAWLQRWTSAGRQELQRLAADFHRVLQSDPAASDIRWYHEADMRKADAPAAPSPEVP